MRKEGDLMAEIKGFAKDPLKATVKATKGTVRADAGALGFGPTAGGHVVLRVNRIDGKAVAVILEHFEAIELANRLLACGEANLRAFEGHPEILKNMAEKDPAYQAS